MGVRVTLLSLGMSRLPVTGLKLAWASLRGVDRRKVFITHAKIERERRQNAPIVLQKQREGVAGVFNIVEVVDDATTRADR